MSRRAAIRFVAARTPTEAARALLADQRIADPGDIQFLGAIIARMAILSSDARERLISIATTVMPGTGDVA